jgi:hypothetical protein
MTCVDLLVIFAQMLRATPRGQLLLEGLFLSRIRSRLYPFKVPISPMIQSRRHIPLGSISLPSLLQEAWFRRIQRYSILQYRCRYSICHTRQRDWLSAPAESWGTETTRGIKPTSRMVPLTFEIHLREFEPPGVSFRWDRCTFAGGNRPAICWLSRCRNC